VFRPPVADLVRAIWAATKTEFMAVTAAVCHAPVLQTFFIPLKFQFSGINL
jgi:hypothetical protein